MGKIKLNLVSGAVVEKPLINAFKANNNSYVVLDNEMNGSMGLPIILVCKLDNGRLIKIADQGEWQVVKEYLKNIIAGNQIEFININNELPADDIYYTQLTLPVPSFDALKNAYKVEETMVTPHVEDSSSVMAPEVEIPTIEPVMSVMPEVEPVAQNVEMSSTPVVEPVTAATFVDNGVSNVSIANPLENPSTVNLDLNTPMPTFGDAVVNPTSVEEPVVQPLEPIVPAEEVSSAEVTAGAEDLFKEQKEAFMQACENMFDALVQKFQKELENHK